MAEIQYNDSSYRFTNPVRKFKKNDPYYWEVDNIPIAQLEENILWLKDQLKKSEVDAPDISVNRADFNELKPYATGGDRRVRVKPGRYTARINDASTLTKLQSIKKVYGAGLGEVDGWNASSIVSNSELETAIEYFTQAPNTTAAMGMNGLVERSFVWAVRDEDTPSAATGSQTSPQQYNGIVGPGGAGPFLQSQALAWAKSTNDSIPSYLLRVYEPLSPTTGFNKHPLVENHFIKMWRGVTRTSIVNVADELNIEVPAFDQEDFHYFDSDGIKKTVPNVQSRVDLVFIYSKPIDAESTKILEGGVVNTISKPKLGIVRGAGIGPSLKGINLNSEFVPTIAYDSNGNPKLLANPSDSVGINMGFESTEANDIAADVKGSFPSPDDLLNLAPLLAEELEATDIELVGQSILPVAYVFVNSADTVVDVEDVIDIRPFFRTTELSYNERAGLAAAVPQVSIANPVATKGLVDKEVKKLYDYTTNLISQDVDAKIQTVGAGYVFGGWHFGPEAVLLDKELEGGLGSQGADVTGSKTIIRKAYGFPGTLTPNGQDINPQGAIPDFPDWDTAFWANFNAKSDKGSYPHDYIDQFHTAKNNTQFKYTSFGTKVNNDGTGGTKISGTTFGANGTFDGESDVKEDEGHSNMFYVSKKIFFNRAENPWLLDYHVDVSFINCAPMTGHQANTWSGIWVEKGWNYFTIYVGFAGRSMDTYKTNKKQQYPEPADRNYIEYFSTFIVPVEDILESEGASKSGSHGFDGSPVMGLCTLPTVMWNMTAVPVSQSEHLHTNLGTGSSTIKLKSI